MAATRYFKFHKPAPVPHKPCYNIRTMKTIAIHLRLATASHRKRMMGIFRFFGAADNWEIRIIPDEDHLCALLQSMNPADIPDGIISGVPYTQKAKELIARSKIPFVGIGTSGDEIDARKHRALFVVNDNEGIGKAAAGFFLRLGDFRTLAFVPDAAGRAWSALRGKAFAETLAAAGKPCRSYLPKKNGKPDEETLAVFLSKLEKPAAVFAAWDGRAADVLHAARIANLKVPDDIAVLGTDDDALICEHTHPPLSSVRPDSEGMGEDAAKLLAGLISGNVRRKSATVSRPVIGIVERESTRPPAPASQLIHRALAFIDAEACNGIRPGDVARHLKVSRRLLDLRFRQYETVSIAEKITSSRIEHAKRLLAETETPVKDAFRRAGFANVANANKLFKDATGMAPTAWRAEHVQSGGGADGPGRPPFEILADLPEQDAADLRELVAKLDPSALFDAGEVRSAVKSRNLRLIVHRRRGRIAAAACIAGFRTPTGTHYRIEDVVVHPKFRGKGIGRRIMLFALDTLRSLGAAGVELTSRPARVAANKLYRSLGFARRETNVYEYRFDRD